MSKRAIVYTRVSSEGQDGEDSYQPRRTGPRVRRLRRGEGIRGLVQTFREIASGADRRRPMFRQMLDAARAGDVDVLVVWRSDRIARGVSSAAELLEAIEIHDVDGRVRP